MSSASIENKSRIGHLDGLRGVLAVVVFIHHFIFCFASAFLIGGETTAQATADSFNIYKLLCYTPLNLFYNAGTAVGLFFILSGYVLSYGYFKSNDLQLVRSNAFKRYIRLTVPILGSCLLVWLLHTCKLIYRTPVPITEINRNWFAGLLPNSLNFPEVLKYALYDVFTGDATYNTVLWTMYRELVGSFLVFAVLLISHKTDHSKKLILLLSIFIFQVCVRSLLANFTLGILLCFLQTNFLRYTRFLSSKGVKMILLLLGIYIASYPFYSVMEAARNSMYRPIFSDSTDVINTIRLFGNGILLIVILNSSKLTALFSAKPFSFLGKISFGLYLIHVPLILAFSTRVYAFLYKYMYNYVSIPLTLIISLIALLGVSWLFYRFVDLYGIKWSSKFARFFASDAA